VVETSRQSKAADCRDKAMIRGRPVMPPTGVLPRERLQQRFEHGKQVARRLVDRLNPSMRFLSLLSKGNDPTLDHINRSASALLSPPASPVRIRSRATPVMLADSV
jgi:hypothetical protein